MTLSLTNPTQEEFETIAKSLMAAKAFSLASCVMLFYDIALTFGEEVEKIWMRKFTPFSALWFANRYISPLAYIVIIVSFHADWSRDVCNRYVLFPEALKVVTTAVIGAIFITRLYAIYSRNTIILVVFICLLGGQLAIKIWSFTDGTYLHLPQDLVGCILTGQHPLRFAFTWISELIFDSAVFATTFWRTAKLNQEIKGDRSCLYHLILRDGIMYFAVIFAANMATVLIFTLAPPNLKAINASFSTLITSLMVSRLILNLRDAGGVREVTVDGRYLDARLSYATNYGTEVNNVHDLFSIRYSNSFLCNGPSQGGDSDGLC